MQRERGRRKKIPKTILSLKFILHHIEKDLRKQTVFFFFSFLLLSLRFSLETLVYECELFSNVSL